jgi:SAM-dependent methyltransferase
MQPYYEKKYLELERSGWWCRARRDMIIRIMSSYPKDTSILEVGCSGGVLLEELGLAGFSCVHGIDISPRAIEESVSRKIYGASVKDAVNTGFKDNLFDVIIASDILEHIRDEDAALREWRRILKSNGCIIIFVPAHEFLWSEHDIANQHFRRYSKTSLLNAITRSDLFMKRVQYWNIFLFIPKLLAHLILKVEKDDLSKYSVFVNMLLYRIIFLENIFIQRGICFPFGVSLLCICSKKKDTMHT